MRSQETAPASEAAFAELAERHRRELQVHCYRMLGSFEDSEDLVQETLLRAWRGRESFAGRSSFRAWLYRIATNACLDALARRPRAPGRGGGPLTEVAWLQPYPDALLEGIAPDDEGPEASLVARETIELAFVAAIQLLPPRQRAVLIARDVLGWSAAESAELLDLSVAAANSALQRARETLRAHLPRRRSEWAAGSAPTAEERALLARYVEASEREDTAAIKALLREDALFSMPPQPEWYEGPDAIVGAWEQGGFGVGALGEFRCVVVGANRQPAVASYLRRRDRSGFRPFTLDVLRIEPDGIVEVVTFPLEPFAAAFDLPRTL